MTTPADPIDDLCARLRKLASIGSGWGMPVIDSESIDKTADRAADALQRLRAERHAATEECNLWHRRARELVDKRDTINTRFVNKRVEWRTAIKRAKCAEAERDALAGIVRAADAMRRADEVTDHYIADWAAYDAARAKWEGK